jgi:hypothetical protein
MIRSSRFLLPFALVALAASLAVGVPRAAAIDPFGPGPTELSGKHFKVHFSSDTTGCISAAFTQEQAGDLLGIADRAYDLYSGWGYTVPVPDNSLPADTLVDISVDDFATQCITFGSIDPGIPGPLSRWNGLVTPVAPAGADEVHLDLATGLGYHIVAHEVFHLFEDAVLTPGTDQWLTEGLAEWAAVHADAAVGGFELNPDRTMDCVGSTCGDSEFDRNGYPGWMLFQYLSEQFGDAKIKNLLDTAAANPSWSGTQILSSVVQPQGLTLGKFFENYTTARLTGKFTSLLLAGVLPQTQGSIVVGSSNGDISPVTLAVNHLAVRFVDLAHGAADSGPCYSASLFLKVEIPAGVASTPYYSANVKGSVPQAFVISGNTASLTVPWNTCGASPRAYVSLPNETNDVVPPALDGREFTLSGKVTVDKTTPAAASEAPAGVKVIGTVIQTPTSDPAPALTLHAPELIRVSAKTRLLRFIVFSSGDGTLKATLGSTWLGSAGLHAGNNDVRYVLPAQLLKSLRKTNTPDNVLTLTSYSPSGAQGASVTRRVAMKPTPKPKPKKRRR